KKKKKHDDGNSDQQSEDTLKLPPGFTPKDDTNVYSKSLNKSEGEFEEGMNEVDFDVREKVSMQRSKEETHGSTCSGHFKKVEFTRLGGSILNLMDELTCWGNFAFDFVHSPSVGKSGGILCMWDPRLFRKTNSTISDYFVILRGHWIPNGNNILIMSIYAPQELSEKKRLWDYLNHVIANWNGEVIVMGDFNEVCTQAERYGLVFNVQGADAFKLFISSAGLVKVPLDGCSFTWCHKSASKMSKIDQFLISKGLMKSYQNISESIVSEPNVILRFIKKLKTLKEKTRSWIKVKKDSSKTYKRSLKGKLADIEALIDKGDANSNILNQSMHVVRSLQDLDKLKSLEVA
nr:RNA-directed DNA polymerase, eukaryota [Tanacetum cinerariifolium]